MRVLVPLLFLACSLLGQQNRPGRYTTETKLYFYDGSNNLEYVCTAWALQASYSWTKAATTLTQIIVATNVGTATTSAAHGLAVGNSVVVSGATVDPQLNATYTITAVGSATTFSFTTVGVSDATYTEATLVAATTSPRSTAAIWSVSKFTYTASLLTRGQWAYGSEAKAYICNDKATFPYN